MKLEELKAYREDILAIADKYHAPNKYLGHWSQVKEVRKKSKKLKNRVVLQKV